MKPNMRVLFLPRLTVFGCYFWPEDTKGCTQTCWGGPLAVWSCSSAQGGPCLMCWQRPAARHSLLSSWTGPNESAWLWMQPRWVASSSSAVLPHYIQLTTAGIHLFLQRACAVCNLSGSACRNQHTSSTCCPAGHLSCQNHWHVVATPTAPACSACT